MLFQLPPKHSSLPKANDQVKNGFVFDFELLLFSPVLNLSMSETIGLNFTLQYICGKESARIQLETGGMQSPILLPKTKVVQYFKYLCVLLKGNKLIKCLLIFNIVHFFLNSPMHYIFPTYVFMNKWSVNFRVKNVHLKWQKSSFTVPQKNNVALQTNIIKSNT